MTIKIKTDNKTNVCNKLHWGIYNQTKQNKSIKYPMII